MHVEVLRQQRREAQERLYQVWLAAALSGGFSLCLLLWIGIDTGEWWELLPYFLAVLGVIGLGRAVVRTQSRIAAGLLLVNAFLAPVAVWLETGRPSGLLIHLVLIFVYFRGFSATLRLAELREREAMQQMAGNHP